MDLGCNYFGFSPLLLTSWQGSPFLCPAQIIEVKSFNGQLKICESFISPIDFQMFFGDDFYMLGIHLKAPLWHEVE